MTHLTVGLISQKSIHSLMGSARPAPPSLLTANTPLPPGMTYHRRRNWLEILPEAPSSGGGVTFTHHLEAYLLPNGTEVGWCGGDSAECTRAFRTVSKTVPPLMLA